MKVLINFGSREIEKVIEDFIKKIPLKRIGVSLDVANIVYYLCVNNNYITGQNIFVDGGYSCAN